VNFDAWIVPSDKFSFPSGHTAAAFLFAWMIHTIYPTFSVIAFIWAALVGLSRVLQGVHYPTDIVAGAALGSSCAYLSINYFSI
jgi:undecaprenyl-diphosphatase